MAVVAELLVAEEEEEEEKEEGAYVGVTVRRFFDARPSDGRVRSHIYPGCRLQTQAPRLRSATHRAQPATHRVAAAAPRV